MRSLTSFNELADCYDGFLFDAYGVLVSEEGVLDGAKRLIDQLVNRQIPFWVVSNGSSKTEAELCQRYQNLGLAVEESQLITSGAILTPYFAAKNYRDCRVAVLGTESSAQYVQRAGGQVVDWQANEPFECAVIANQTGFPLLEGLDRVLTGLFERFEQDQFCELIITNPDLIYPQGQQRFGITAGSLGLILEESLVLRYGERARRHISKLGKPFAPIFDEAVRRAGGSRRLLMIGDQLHTDIAGARNYGLDSLLLGTGVTPPSAFADIPDHLRPTFTLDRLRWE
jgi:HAD superfamily hydrolase (TIGR01450 family)